jgi:hypothetical protein
MTRKGIRKLMEVVMVLQVLIMVTIANNLAPTSSAPSIPIMLPNFSQLDKYQKPGHQEPKPKLVHEKPKHEEQEPTLHTCLTKKFEHCEKVEDKLDKWRSYNCTKICYETYVKNHPHIP